MLNSLKVQNYALIEKVDVDLSTGLNIVTGETGAGKSILLGALGLILGKRADTSVLFSKEQKCIVEGEIALPHNHLREIFEEHELDYINPIILRREISAQGRSRAFINDTPVTLQLMSLVGSGLVEMHEQFDHLQIRSLDFHRDSLDAMAQNHQLLSEYTTIYQRWRKSSKELQKLNNSLKERQSQQEFIKFQFDELDKIGPMVGEEDNLREEQETLNNAEDIKLNLLKVSRTLDQDEQSIVPTLARITQNLRNFDSIKSIAEICQRLESVKAELVDLSTQADDQQEQLEFDPQRAQEIEERLSELFQLAQKHNLTHSDQLVSFKNQLEEQIIAFDSDTHGLNELEKKVDEEYKNLLLTGGKISVNRKKTINQFEAAVQEKLNYLSMENALLQVKMTSLTSPGPQGLDEVEFLFSGNKGLPPASIKSTASGGEISRLNLAIKSIVAGKMDLPILIFDEIDSGVSGEVANRIGHLLYLLGQDHQVICITHTPQIASKGDYHLHVVKSHESNRTSTQIRILDRSQRVTELARMLDGDPPSQAAISNAENLINQRS